MEYTVNPSTAITRRQFGLRKSSFRFVVIFIVIVIFLVVVVVVVIFLVVVVVVVFVIVVFVIVLFVVIDILSYVDIKVSLLPSATFTSNQSSLWL
jgi:prepilin signal peptidase PulO-like enzyme (type II secretory pathway)